MAGTTIKNLSIAMVMLISMEAKTNQAMVLVLGTNTMMAGIISPKSMYAQYTGAYVPASICCSKNSSPSIILYPGTRNSSTLK